MDVRVGLLKNSWAQNWCFWTVVLEKTLESSLDCKEIQVVHSKGDLSWVFIGRTDAKAETPILWPPHVKSWLIGKDPDAGRDWGQEEKGTSEDEMVGWHHRLNGHGIGWTPEVGDAEGSLECCNSQRVGHDWAIELTWTGGESKVQCCKEQYCIGTWNVRPMNQCKLEEIKQEMGSVTLTF